MVRFKNLIKNSILIIIVIFLVIVVMDFCNKGELSSFFIHYSKIFEEIIEGEKLGKNTNQSETNWQWLNDQNKLYVLILPRLY